MHRALHPSLLALLSASLVLLAVACPGKPETGATFSGRQQQSAEPQAKTPAKRLAVVLGASETDPWTAALINTIGAELNIDPLSKGATQAGLDIFGPFECMLEGEPVELHLAICDLNSVADVAAQAKLGELAQAWIKEQNPAAVWLDGDQLQLQCGSKLDPALPIVFTGVEVRSDAYYDQGRAVCGLMRQHSLARTMGELFKVVKEPHAVALAGDDSPQARTRLAEVRNLEQAMPFGVTFVLQEPVKSWKQLGAQLKNLDSGIDAVIVCGVGGAGGGLAGSDPPAGLLKGLKQPVFVYGPSPLDNSGVLSLRIKPAAHARAALGLASKLLAGQSAAPLGITIPDEMDLYQTER